MEAMKFDERELVCISCPIGCRLTAYLDEDGKVIEVKDNMCKRGKTYAEKELTNPTRIVVSTVKVEGGRVPLVSVKTETDIPKGKIFDIMNEINNTKVKAPVKLGDIIIENVSNTGVNVIVTKSIF